MNNLPIKHALADINTYSIIKEKSIRLFQCNYPKEIRYYAVIDDPLWPSSNFDVALFKIKLKP